MRLVWSLLIIGWLWTVPGTGPAKASDSTDQVTDQAHGLTDRAVLARRMGQPDQALVMLNQAVGMIEDRQGPSSGNLIAPLLKLADLYASGGGTALAEATWRRAIRLIEQRLGTDHPALIQPLAGLAGSAARGGRFDEAEASLKRALEIAQPVLGGDHPRIAMLMDDLARLYEDWNRPRDALSLLRRAVAIYRSLSGHPDRAETLPDRRRMAQAYDRYLEHLFNTRPSRQDRRGTRDFLDQGFEVLQLLQMAPGEPARRALAQGVADGRGKGAAKVAGLIAGRTQVTRIMDRLMRAAADPFPPLPRAAIALRERLLKTRRQVSMLDKQLYYNFERVSEYANPIPRSLGETRVQVKSDTALLVFAGGTTHSYLWVLRHDRVDAYRLPLGAARFRALIAAYRANLSTGAPLDLDLPRELYINLLAPAEKMIIGARRLIVVDDGTLSDLPLPALLSGEPAAQTDAPLPWLVRRHAITRLPTVSSLLGLRYYGKRGRGRVDLVDLGKGPAMPVTRQRLGEADVAKARGLSIPAPLTLDASPHLLLADGPLTPRDIATLDLHADWVLLTPPRESTPTAIGHGAPGLAGLVRSLFYAGSRAVLLRRWADPSGTDGADVATLLKTSTDRAETLRQRALERLRDRRTAHPRHWASYQLFGLN